MMNCTKVELGKVLTKDELKFCDIRIPFNDTTGLWVRLTAIQRKVSEAIASGEVSPIKTESFVKGRAPRVVSDDLGVQGVVNPVNGKRYDSKSAYYRAVKESGSHIIEAGESGKERKQQGDYNVREELKEAIEQHLGR